MKTIKNKIADDLYVDEDTILDGMVAGSVIVRSSAKLVINGVVTGNLVIEDGGEAELNGMVSGDVYNQGGVFVKTGILAGTIIKP